MVVVVLMTLVLVMILVMVMILTANPRDALVAMGEEAGKTCKQVQRVLFTDEEVGIMMARLIEAVSGLSKITFLCRQLT